MGFYERQVLPRINEKSLDRPDIAELRDRVWADLRGHVLEIGFGSGLNVGHYPPSVTRVLAVEPSEVARRHAKPRIRQSPIPVELVGRDAQQLSLPDASVDSGLVTWTLCGLPDPHTAARELFRVLAPGGAVAYLEHGLCPDPDVVRWQKRLNGWNHRVGGCWLDRDPRAILLEAGFVVDRDRSHYLEHAARFTGYVHEGLVRKPEEDG